MADGTRGIRRQQLGYKGCASCATMNNGCDIATGGKDVEHGQSSSGAKLRLPFQAFLSTSSLCPTVDARKAAIAATSRRIFDEYEANSDDDDKDVYDDDYDYDANIDGMALPCERSLGE